MTTFGNDDGGRLWTRRRAAQMAGLAALTPAATACAVDLPGSGTPPRIYVLTPKSTFPENLPSVDWQLLVEAPAAPAGISSTRIALRRTPVELNYFARAAWTDGAPKMIQRLLIESFENSGKIVSVGRQVIGLRADFILKTDLREFQAEYMEEDGTRIPETEPPNIRARLNAKLIAMPARRIVASKTWEYNLPAEGSDMADIVTGFDFVLGKIQKRLVAWTLRTGEEVMANQRAEQS